MDDHYTFYTPNLGFQDLRERIAEKVSEENGIDADPRDEIIVTAGAMQAISLAILVTINPGDEVVITDPAYESFERQVRFAGGVPRFVEVKEEDEFKLRAEEVEKVITKKTKMIIINSPANPTGAVMERPDVTLLAELAKEHNLLILSDEIYEKILYDGATHISIASLPGMRERTISIFGVSKTYAMTGWRIGYAIANKRIVEQMNKIQEFYVTCASSISQRAALAALEGPQDCVREMVAEFRKRRDFLYSKLEGIDKIGCVKPKGAFYLFPNITKTGYKSTQVAEELLMKGKVVTVPGEAFGKNYGDNFIRICYATSMENLELAAERMRKVFDEV
jgi:aspartate/methionine/tyrosine aminotransferase